MHILERAGERRSDRKGFGLYSPETERRSFKAEVVSSPVLETLMSSWSTFYASGIGPVHSIGGLYRARWDSLCRDLGGVDYSPAEVEKVSVLLAGFQGNGKFPASAGAFLSALVNSGKDGEFTLHIAYPVAGLCFGCRKTVHIKGNAGDEFGYKLRKGACVTVEGMAGDKLGANMTGGTITIDGDAGAKAGFSMKNGLVLIKGDAGEFVGFDMRGGTIILEGDASSISRTMLGGKICQKGVLIAE